MSKNSDSDTESEAGSTSGHVSAIDTSSLTPLGSHLEARNGKLREDHEVDVKFALKTIKCIDMAAVRLDTTLHADILRASDVIVNFLDDIRTFPLTGEAMGKNLASFIELLHVPFLSILFDLRKVFHSIAAQALVPGAAASTIVCWVDVILAKLGEAAVSVATGFSQELSEQPIFETLRKQRDDDSLRAAAQLPRTWHSVPTIVASDCASPAAKRLALRLMFAVYVIAPHFKVYDPWNDGGVRPSEMMKLLHLHLNHIPSIGFPELQIPNQLHLQERITYAIIVSLFAVTECMERDLGNTQSLSPLRPHTLSSLLDLICLVMYPNQTISTSTITSPCESLDSAQTILVRWGETLPWCWVTWNEPRVANTECITFLTTTWLHHLDTPLFEVNPDDPETLEPWALEFTSHLMRYPVASRSALLQILHHSVFSLCSYSQQESLPSSSLDVIYKTCWAMVQLATMNRMSNITPFFEQFPLDVCRCLCSLFVLLGDISGELRIKGLIVEALTSVNPQIFLSCLQRLRDDPKVRFVSKLDEAIVRSKRKLTDDCTSNKVDLLTIKLMLNFLAIMWHNKARGYVHHQTVSPFFVSLMDALSLEQSGSLSSKMLRDSLFTTLSTMEVMKADHPFDDDSIIFLHDEALWGLGLESESTDLVVASGFAHYVLATGRVCDSLTCADAWDYLRDVVLLILSRHFHGDDEPLALVICPILCGALIRLVQANPQATQFVLSSPWTMNLCSDLQNLLSDNVPTCTYFVVLKERLGLVGKTLLNQISSKLADNKGSPLTEILAFESDLVISYVHPTTRLLLVPRV